MTKIVTGKWVGAAQNRWPIGRGVAIYMRPDTAARHLDAGVRLGDRMVAAGAAIRRVLHDLFAPLDVDRLAKERGAEPAAVERPELQEKEAA